MNQNRNIPPDPRDYDMYSAFRTRERGEARRQNAQQKQRSSYYDAYAQRAEEEQNKRKEAQRRRMQAEAQRAPQQRNAAQTPAGNQSRITYGQGLSDPSRRRIRTEVPLPNDPPAPRRSRNADAQTFGTRVQNTADNEYRYGYHSSYRTADGRILDGFDAKGRPIYREESASGGAAVVPRSEFVPEAAETYRQPRRIRIETLADTDTKPFPFKIILTVAFCTALVMAVLYAYMRLNEYTNTMSYLSYQLSNLRAETNALQAELVRREDLLSIEQTAAEVLGMVKTDVLTKKYVTIENEDKTEVIAKLEEEERRRISVEIDLDTGKPMTKQEGVSGYIPPTQNTEEAVPPTTAAPDETTDPTSDETADTDAAEIAADTAENT
ncbi:MAG: hypothetical protein IKZ09_11925 [Clostridia bacterium]|nr:hypothetical protein [Clostridia bacterium]